MFRWKHYVYEVYKEKSFSKAAQNLYISQPSLSARIKKIEDTLGVPLFVAAPHLFVSLKVEKSI